MADYDPRDYTLSINGVEVDPDGIDNFITWEPSADLVTRTAGTTGEQVHNTNTDTSGTLTVRLLQTSRFNDWLSVFAGLDASFIVRLHDRNGTTEILSHESKVKRFPNLDLAAEVGNNEWALSMLNVIPFIGGKPGIVPEPTI